jgi:hypothetical protein
LSETSNLKAEIGQLEDEALRRRFGALFDDGQGDNARRAFVAYCRARNYSAAEINLLYGGNLFQRMRNMLERQDKLLDEYKSSNKFLAEQVRRLNGGKAILPPRPEVAKRGERFQRLVRDKFGDRRGGKFAACEALGLTPSQYDRLVKGIDVTDAVIEQLENLPDHARTIPISAKLIKKKAPQKARDPRLTELETRFAHIPKPRKFGPRSDMTPEELSTIGKSLFGDEWIAPLAQFIKYGQYHLTRFTNGDTSRYIRKETADYIRRVDAEAKVLPRLSVLPLPSPGGNKRKASA